MSLLTDIIGSFLIGGMILLMMVGFRTNLCTTTETHVFSQGVQETMRSTTEILESDLRKIGYRVPAGTSRIKDINDSTITFCGDFDNSGTNDSIRYYFRSTKPAGAHNPSIGSFYRVLNNQSPTAINCGMTRFALAWYSQDGNFKPTDVNSIRSLKLSLLFESDTPSDSIWTGSTWRRVYSGASWERTIKPKNLR